jgi:hypothetical protein
MVEENIKLLAGLCHAHTLQPQERCSYCWHLEIKMSDAGYSSLQGVSGSFCPSPLLCQYLCSWPHQLTGAMASAAKSFFKALLSAGQYIAAGAHGASNQYRLTWQIYHQHTAE